MSNTRVGMKNTVRKLKSLGYDLSSMRAIDLFARTGEWQTQEYASEVLHVTAWEINRSFKELLEKNLPTNSEVVIGDSHDLIKKTKQSYDMLVSDNPMGCYGNYCEHFDIFDDLTKIMNPKAILCLNIKTEPFDYDAKKAWQEKRNAFYGVCDSACLSRDFIINFYTNAMAKKNKIVSNVIWEKRPQETGLYLLTMCLEDNLCKS